MLGCHVALPPPKNSGPEIDLSCSCGTDSREVNMNKFIGAFLSTALLCCTFSKGAVAQVGLSCTAVVGNGCYLGSYGGSTCPGWYDCQTYGPWLVMCNAKTYSCSPTAGATETHCTTCETAGSPIDLATGNTYIQQTDIKLPGLGGLTFARTWNSMWPITQADFRVGYFGSGWRSTFEERIFLGSDHYIKYARSDGNFWSFGVGGPGWRVAAPANAGATLVAGSAYWTVTFKSGEQRLFDNASGNLIAIIDRNGNQTQISYDGGGRPAMVTDPASRHLYFHYANDASFLITSITSDFGVTVSYSYNSDGNLAQVTEPDQSTISFLYDSSYVQCISYGNCPYTIPLITAVKDSQGKILEAHTYDSLGRGTTSSRANGVDGVTLSYPEVFGGRFFNQ